MNCGVYCIKNTVNQKVYIGSSCNLLRRIKAHITALNKKRHQNRFLQNAFSSDGAAAFQIEILENCSEDKLLERELYYITLFKSLDRKFGYNLAPFPFQGSRGVKWSSSSKARLSSTLKKNYASGERRPAVFQHSEEGKHKIAAAGKGRKPPNCRAVWCHQTGQKYRSLHEAAKMLNVGVSAVLDVIKKRKRFAHGYTFDYADDSLCDIRPMMLSSKRVLCVNTGITYSSPAEAARSIGVAGGEIGRAIRCKRALKGNTFQYVEEMNESED